MSSPSKTWNVVFPVSTIEKVRERASEIGVTPAGLVRSAVDMYLREPERATKLVANPSFIEGVERTLELMREEMVSPRFPSGQTFGDRVAQRILVKLNM
jgi:hypothetical protein